jgi:signal transduction histidine kinase
MDHSNEGLLLIWTTTFILLAFLISLLSVMIIYRRRRITHKKEIESMNEKFTREVLQSQMETQQLTMQQIGREIHDDVGQKLVLASLYIQQIPFANENAKDKIHAVSSIIHESLADLRNLSRGLIDANNEEFDLCSLIEKECGRVLLSRTCKAQFSSNVSHIHVSQTIKNFILRILQEFIQNSLKHSECTLIEIRLEALEEYIEINAFDNGIGFISSYLPQHPGIGIKNMEKRAKMIGAEFQLITSPHAGTRIILQVPNHKLNE